MVPAGAVEPFDPAVRPKGVPDKRPLPVGRGGTSRDILGFCGGVGADDGGPLPVSAFLGLTSASDCRECCGRLARKNRRKMQSRGLLRFA